MPELVFSYLKYRYARVQNVVLPRVAPPLQRTLPMDAVWHLLYENLLADQGFFLTFFWNRVGGRRKQGTGKMKQRNRSSLVFTEMQWFTLTFLEGLSQMQLSGLNHPEGSTCHSQSILVEPGIPMPPTPTALGLAMQVPIQLSRSSPTRDGGFARLRETNPKCVWSSFSCKDSQHEASELCSPSSPHSCTSLLRIESEQEKGQPVSSSWLPFL